MNSQKVKKVNIFPLKLIKGKEKKVKSKFFNQRNRIADE